MAQQQHGDTESRLDGFEARIQAGFEWANAHGREIVIGIVVFLLAGGVLAGVANRLGQLVHVHRP